MKKPPRLMRNELPPKGPIECSSYAERMLIVCSIRRHYAEQEGEKQESGLTAARFE